MKILFLWVLVISNLATSQNQISENPCSKAHEGTFLYGNSKMEVTVYRTEYVQVDKIFYNKSTYYIHSEINWINDCEYELKMISSTMPKFKYQPGDVLNIKIDKIERKDVYYTTSIGDDSWQNIMTKQK